MDYIREINAFERWLETNYLPCLSQLLWYRLMALSNRAGWPEWVQVDNLRLMALIQCGRQATLIEIRDKLIANGLIEFRRGKKGSPNQYKICSFAGVLQTESKTETETAPNNAQQTAHISSYPTDTRKTKTKTNTKSTSESRLDDYFAAINTRSFSPPLVTCIVDWLRYKTERREKYADIGLSKLLTIFERKAAELGEDAVIYAVDQSIANNWQGIVWDKAHSAPTVQAKSRDVEYVNCDDEEV